MKPKVSIIIPVYNSKNFDSIIENNYENLEIIPVNDESKDEAQEIIEEYEKI